jgi:ribosomal protein S18 acetylase RimI-like enzyme/RNAse (barnase) inhibitor barstar
MTGGRRREGEQMREGTTSLRRGTLADLPRLAEIHAEARNAVGCYPRQEPSEQQLSQQLEGEEILVAVMTGRICGFVSVWPPERFVHHLYVSPDAQGLGVGSLLLDACVTRYGLPLTLKCDHCNERAREFYWRRGWVTRDHGTGEHGPWDELVLEDPDAKEPPAVPFTRVTLDLRRIIDWESFHEVFATTLGFPGYYGRNMNAWIDCMTCLDDEDAGMTSVHAPRGGVLVLELEHLEDFRARCREIHDALFECAAFVNGRRMEDGAEGPVLVLSALC